MTDGKVETNDAEKFSNGAYKFYWIKYRTSF